jgi:hypothetical protein
MKFLLANYLYLINIPFLHELDVITTLKSSLAEALEYYPPVAGTVRVNEEGEGYIAVDGTGADFQVSFSVFVLFCFFSFFYPIVAGCKGKKGWAVDRIGADFQVSFSWEGLFS